MLFSRTAHPSGVRVLTEHMPEVRSASLGFWFGVGSRDETPEVQGSSHFLEHLLFKGTSTRGAQEIAEAFDAVGGEANAFSTKEYTCVYARVLDRDLPMAYEILSDMVRNPAIRDDDVINERRVVLEEIAMHEDTPDDLVHDVLAETLFGDHPLAREVMGTVESVASISGSGLREFHEATYHGKNLVVAVAGNVDHEQVVEWTSEFATDDRLVPARDLITPTPAGRVRVETRQTEQTHIALGGLGLSRNHPDRFAWGILDNILGGGMSSRLFQEVRERRGLAYAIFSYRNSFMEAGSWAVYAGTSPTNVAEVLKLIEDELDKILDEGITEEELERAKGHTRGGVVLALEDSSSRMSRLGKSELVQGEILSVDQIISRVDAVTLQDVERVARELLPNENRVLAVIGPNKEINF